MRSFGCCLGFDFGLKKIGVAVGQFITLTSSPLPYIGARDGHPDMYQLKKLIHEWHPDCLVLGFPQSVDGQDLSVTPKVQQFGEVLKQFKLPVYFTDERMTTKEARQILFELGGFKALAYGKSDSIAAAIILEQWMNEVDV
jgi:putative Holliday junction resolvase